MPRRVPIDLVDVAAWPNLMLAFQRAARGRTTSAIVRAFAGQLDANLRRVQRQILDQRAPFNNWRVFHIRDPKPRRIVAPCFEDRVLHHALMAHVGPVLDRALIDDTYACRESKGSLAAVRRVQRTVRRWPWVVKADFKQYFASIDTPILMQQVIARRIKGQGALELSQRILDDWPGPLGRGLPIGALTSQFFANSYLDVADRVATEQLKVSGYVRYMDDLVWACASREQARNTWRALRDFAIDHRGLELKPPLIRRSRDGVPFLGYRILPGTLRLSLRRKRRYRAARVRWEARYRDGDITAAELQRGYASAEAITRHADAIAWRREQLRRVPAVDA